MMKCLLLLQIVLPLLSLVLATSTQAAAERLLYAKGEKITYLSAARYEGITDNKEIDTTTVSLGRAYYLTDGLGLYGELLALAARGERSNIDANAEGVGAFFALRWHFIRSRHWGLFMNHGIGPVLFLDEFPPGGTKLNGLIQYGLGMSVRIHKSRLFHLGIRHSHISNGKGMVDKNPTFDGRGIYFEMTQPF